MYRDSKAPSISGEKRLAEIIQLTILLICNLLQRKVINSWLIHKLYIWHLVRYSENNLNLIQIN